MKTELKTVLAATALWATPTMAHVGPEAIDHHLAEHLLIALAIGFPMLYGLLRLIKRGGDSRR